MAYDVTDLPRRLPIFPLSSALLLPGRSLPLNVFEPRYLQMVEDVLGADRFIGVVQPTDPDSEESDPELQSVGCAGRVTAFREAEDSRYLIQLHGLCRFEVVREIDREGRLYRTVEPSWERFADDLRTRPEADIDRDELLAHMRSYLEARDLEANWEAVEDTEDAELVDMLAMSCPFEPTEKQALLEADDVDDRSQLMVAMMNMASLEGAGPATHH